MLSGEVAMQFEHLRHPSRFLPARLTHFCRMDAHCENHVALTHNCSSHPTQSQQRCSVSSLLSMANPLEHRAATRGLVGSFQTLSLAWPSRRSAALWTPSGGCCRHGLLERKCAAAGGMAGAGCAAGRMGKETPSGGHGGRQQRLARTIDFACIQAMPRLAKWCVQSGVGSRSCDQASTAVAWACMVVDRVVCVLQACFVRRPECANLACAVIGVPCLRWSVLSERVECPCVGWWWLQVKPRIGKPSLCMESTQLKPQCTEVRATWCKSLETKFPEVIFDRSSDAPTLRFDSFR